MFSVRDKIVSLSDAVGSYTDAQIGYYLNESVASVYNVIPERLWNRISKVSTFNGSSLSLPNEKVISVFLSGEPAKRIDVAHSAKAANASSIYYASATNPVFWLEARDLKVLPNTNGWKVHHVPTPSVDIQTPADLSAITSITDLAQDIEHIVLLRACAVLLRRKSRDLASAVNTVLSDIRAEFSIIQDIIESVPSANFSSAVFSAKTISLTAMPVVPNSLLNFDVSIVNKLPELNKPFIGEIPSVPAFSYNPGVAPVIDKLIEEFGFEDFSEIALEEYDSLAPISDTLSELSAITFPTPPTITPDFNAAMPATPTFPIDPVISYNEVLDALTKASEFLGVKTSTSSTNAPDASHWLSDEDEDMAAATVNVAKGHIERASVIAGTNRTSAETYIAQINGISSKHKSEIDAYIAKISGESQRIKALSETYIAQTKGYETQIGYEVQKQELKTKDFANKLASFNSRLQSINAGNEALFKKFTLETQQRFELVKSKLEHFNAELTKYNVVEQANYNSVKLSLENYLGSIQLYSQNIQRYIQERQSSVAEYNAVLGQIQLDIQKNLQQESLNLQRFQTEVQKTVAENEDKIKELQFQVLEFSTRHKAIADEYAMKLQEFNLNLQSKSSTYSLMLNKASQKLQSIQFDVSSYQSLLQESINLYQTFQIELKNYIGVTSDAA